MPMDHTTNFWCGTPHTSRARGLWPATPFRLNSKDTECAQTTLPCSSAHQHATVRGLVRARAHSPRPHHLKSMQSRRARLLPLCLLRGTHPAHAARRARAPAASTPHAPGHQTQAPETPRTNDDARRRKDAACPHGHHKAEDADRWGTWILGRRPGNGALLRARVSAFSPPMRAWLEQPHGRHHKAPPQPRALTNTRPNVSKAALCPISREREKLNKRPDLLGRLHCKGVAIGVARRGGRRSGERTLRIPPP